MKLKATLALFAAMTLGLILSACSLCQDFGNTTHENNSSSILLDVPIAKLPEAIKAGAAKAGYTSLNKVNESPIDGEFQAEGIDITYKKIDEAKTKMFVRVGALGAKDKEALIINEIERSLGLKK